MRTVRRRGEDRRRLDGFDFEARFTQLSTVLPGRGGELDPARVVWFAARALRGGGHVGLTRLPTPGRGRGCVLAATDELPERVEALQYECRQGPCLGAIEDFGMVRVDDLARDGRWPTFAARCVGAHAVRSMIAIHLPVSGAPGALTFYARRPFAFDNSDADAAAFFASYACLALQQAVREQEIANLEAASASSRQIGTAVGILMTRGALSADQAFQQLAQVGDRLNRKLRDVAAEVARTGELPATP